MTGDCACESNVDVVPLAGVTTSGSITKRDAPCDPYQVGINPDGSIWSSGCDNGEGCEFDGSVTFTRTSDNNTADVDAISDLGCGDNNVSSPAIGSGGATLGVVIFACSDCQR